MHDFYGGMPAREATEIERLSRLVFELRSHRDRLLADWGAPDEDVLLHRIRAGEVAEHPAYEAVLAARILDGLRRDTRILIDERLRALNPR